ncbi:RNA-binding protein FUS-like [Symsagittifera roscoffensis]|uniref:RNA-binding protein FUS-like n=1 Tax=Symsagittifera roscoffensis TaxID=84072 RepID=UPI00307C2D58
MSFQNETASSTAQSSANHAASTGQTWPDYSAAYAAYYQNQASAYGQFAVGTNAQNGPENPYTGYGTNVPYNAYPHAQSMYPPADKGSSAANAPVNISSSDEGKSSKDSSTPQMGSQPFYANPQSSYNSAAAPPNYYNYNPMPPAPYGDPNYAPPPPPQQFVPPSPYQNQYNNPRPNVPHNQGPHNSGFYNSRPPVRPYNRGGPNQPPAWTNDAGTIKVEGFPTDVTLDELRNTFNVGALKKDNYSGFDQICVSPDRQCAFLTFEDPSVAEAAVVMLNESNIRGQKIAVQIYDGNYHNQGFKRRMDDNHHGDSNYQSNYDKRPRFEYNNNRGGGHFQNNFRDRGPNWPCIACNASNHGHRWNCYKCRAPKPDLEKNGSSGGAGMGGDPNFPSTHNRTADDWICSSCNNHNFAKRLVCNRCKLPKPPNPTLAPMSGANNTPIGVKTATPTPQFSSPVNPTASVTWTCAPCGTSNELVKLICVKCQNPKPGIPQKTLEVLNKLNALGKSSSDQPSNGQSAGSRWGEK